MVGEYTRGEYERWVLGYGEDEIKIKKGLAFNYEADIGPLRNNTLERGEKRIECRYFVYNCTKKHCSLMTNC